MAELSPEAQVMVAVTHIYQEHAGEPPARAIAAAALRAAADQAEDVCPARPFGEWGEGWLEGVKDVVAGLRRIATKLESAQ